MVKESKSSSADYMKTLRKRGTESHVYKQYQLLGLEIADILTDRKHKALYIKLVKEGDSGQLLRMAKDVADRKDVKNKGAYFMTVVQQTKLKNSGAPIKDQKKK